MARAFETKPGRAPLPAAQRPAAPTRTVPPAADFPQLARRLHLGAPIQRRAGDGPGRDFSGIAGPGRPPLPGGLPAGLRADVEARSGLPMDDVRVHRNSPKPRTIGALAYAQGRDIHLGPGQERHLAHEAWHVVQQKQGRVRATGRVAGTALNDDASLEREADRFKRLPAHPRRVGGMADAARPMSGGGTTGGPAQRKLIVEQNIFEHLYKTDNRFRSQVVASLNALLTDSGVRAVESSGVISLHGVARDPADPRVRLLGDVIASPQSVFVRRTAGPARTDFASGRPLAEEARKASDGTGTQAVVMFDPRHTDMLPTVNGLQIAPSWLILAHELIHAGRVQRGRAAMDPDKGEHQIGVYRNLVSNRPEIGKIEEIQTVGLPALTRAQIAQALSDGGALQAYRQASGKEHLLRGSDELYNQGVTENAIRHVVGLPARSSYETVMQSVLVMEGPKIDLGAILAKHGHGSRGIARPAALFGLAALVLFLAWYVSHYLPVVGEERGDGPAQLRRGEPAGYAPPGGVAQRVGVAPDTWGDASAVRMLQDGVFKVSGDSGAAVFKISADTKITASDGFPAHADEAAAARLGQRLGVNTVVPHLYKRDALSPYIDAISKLQPNGQELAEGLKETDHFLVMPYVDGQDIDRVPDRISSASAPEQYAWGKELGRIFVFDLIISNPDRHGANVMLSSDGQLHSIDQAIGSKVKGEGITEEDVKSHLRGRLGRKSDLEKAYNFFFRKVMPKVTSVPQRMADGFYAGVEEGSESMRQMDPAAIEGIYDEMREGGGSSRRGIAPNMAATLSTLDAVLPRRKPDGEGGCLTM